MFRAFSFALTIGLVSSLALARGTFAPGDPLNDSEVQKPMMADPVSRKLKKDPKYFFDAGLDLRDYAYEEPGFVKHSGFLYGVWASLIAKTDWGTFGFDSSVNYGNSLNYDGSICEINSGVMTCSPYSTSKQQDLITKSTGYVYLPVSEFFRFRTGAGFRYLSDSVPEAGFYLRTGVWFYIPAGIEITDDSNSNYRWKYSLTYNYVAAGGIKSNLSEVSSRYSDVYMPQTGYGTDFSVQLRYQIRYVIGAFYETWNLNISDEVATGGDVFHEPANQSRVIGLRFGFDFY
jgi:hypothetical protein